MLFSRRAHRPNAGYRPTVCVLEDRTVPVAFRTLFPVPAPPPPATHFAVLLPQDVEVGKAFSVTVEAEDAKNHVVPTFRGTTQVSLAGPDAGAVYPASFTFSAADKGKHTFQMTLTATGAQTVKAVSGTRTGQAVLTVDGPVTHFAVSAPTPVNAGTPFMFTVAALDANNHIVPGYTGTVHLSSTDPYAVLPTDYKFQPSDHGNHVYYATTFNTPATQTITATAAGSLLGSAQINVVSPWLVNPYGYGYGGVYNGMWNGVYSPYGMVVGGWGYW